MQLFSSLRDLLFQIVMRARQFSSHVVEVACKLFDFIRHCLCHGRRIGPKVVAQFSCPVC